MKYCDDEIHFDWHCDDLKEGPYEVGPFEEEEFPFEIIPIDPVSVGMTEDMESEPDVRWCE